MNYINIKEGMILFEGKGMEKRDLNLTQRNLSYNKYIP